MKKQAGRVVWEEDLFDIENRLWSTLQPVDPRPEFVDHLRTYLSKTETKGRSEGIRPGFIFLAIAGILSSVLIIATGIRTYRSMQEAIRQRRSITTLS